MPSPTPRTSTGSSTSPRVTIVDVAKEAGVQPSTVSKALNQGRGSAEVRRRVEEAAAQLGYRPNRQARGLRQARSSSIAVLVPDLANPVFLPFLRGVEATAQAHGYVIAIADGQRSGETESAALDRFFDQGVDGLVLGGPAQAAGLRLFAEHRVPVVPSSGPDGRRYWERGEAAATREMGARLVELGHRNVLFAGTPQPRGHEARTYRRDRFSTLSRGLRSAGATLDAVVVDPRAGVDEARAQFAEVLGRHASSAVVCASHLLAPWLLLALADLRLRVPNDVSVVVYGDSDWAQAVRPALSVVRRDTFAEGCDLALQLIAQIEGTEAPAPTAPPAVFVERRSLSPAAAAG